MYRKIKCSERLPIINAWYFVKFNYDIPNNEMKGKCAFHPFDSEISDQYEQYVEWWLEPIDEQAEARERYKKAYKLVVSKGYEPKLELYEDIYRALKIAANLKD